MKLFNKNLDDEIAVIAEIGNNHEGDLSLAMEMIEQAAQSGADAVKFQTIIPEFLVSRSGTERFERLKKFQFSADEFMQLQSAALKSGIHFLSTPFDLVSADLICNMCDVVKISSSDNNFIPLIEKIANFGKHIIMSTGLAGSYEIARAKGLIEAIWEAGDFDNPELILLHCVSSYPVSPIDANLSAIPVLRQKFGGVVGYSDHTLGVEAAVLSVAAGAQVIEKHFTLDKNLSDFRDHQLSVTPDELAELVDRVAVARSLMGSGKIQPENIEAEASKASRRSIVAIRDLHSGDILSWADITWLRPGGGMAPGIESKILGRRLHQDVASGTPLSLDQFS